MSISLAISSMLLLGSSQPPAGDEIAVLKGGSSVHHAAVSRDGSQVALANSRNQVLLLDMKTRSLSLAFQSEETINVSKVIFDHSGAHLIMVCFPISGPPGNMTLRWWHLASDKIVKEVPIKGRVLDVVSSEKVAVLGPRMVDNPGIHRIEITDLGSGKTAAVRLDSKTPVRKAQFTSDGKRIVVLFAPPPIGSEITPLPPPPGEKSQKMKIEHGDVRIVDYEFGKAATLPVQKGTDDFYISADGNWLVTRNIAGEIWDLRPDAKIKQKRLSANKAVLSQGRIGLNLSREQWEFNDVESGKKIASLSLASLGRYIWNPKHVVVTPDERYIVGGGTGGRICIWEIPKEVREFGQMK